MKRWAFIHPLSGAIVMVTTSAAAQPPAHLDRRAAPAGVDPGIHWWNGWSFAPREDAELAVASEGGRVAIACPDNGWLAMPDGSISQDRDIAAPAGRARITLVGRYRGECWIEAQP